MALLKSRIKRAEKLINGLYTEEINPYHISLQYREENEILGDEYTYGEVVVPTLAELLQITRPQPNEIFYDLGCGAGRAVFSAALCFPFLHVKGIELLPPLYEVCTTLKKRFDSLVSEDEVFKKDSYDIEFLHGNLLRKNFSKGTLFFLNATCFRDKDWQALQKKLLKLAVGTRFIVVTRQLEDPAFQLIEGATYQMSWGPSSVHIYRKVH
jgi:SAM-dependent methyltransferase